MNSFGTGLVLGAVLVAFITAILGGIVQGLVPWPVRLAVAGAAAVAVIARESGLVSYPIPENRRLVPEYVQTRGAGAGALQFGFEMGTGMRTYSPSALPHLIFVVMLTVLPFAGALVAGLGFALARWLMPAASNAYSDDGGWSDLWDGHKRLLAIAMTVATIAPLVAITI